MSGYDEHLLADAPAATREQKQESYKLDLLNDSEGATNTHNETTPDALLAPSLHHDREAGAGLSTKERIESPYSAPRSTTPWYRTKRWILIFLVIGVVVVAAVVGGAVGGTVGHHHNNNNNNNSTNSTDSSSSGSGGQAGAPDSGGGGVGGASGTASVAPVGSGASIGGANGAVAAEYAAPTGILARNVVGLL
ncbi:hypothetical protein BDY19DRAFT_546482 [Irpex rosettiformis]|uniref:Uncharacterized protein n=1 Tax=Irpex rosettiformis TaxID=378272 RepID=A0ACB8TQM3_9APHY|nr:hypothetical protein BDY19DRAFT_546482 [Irpex rosettiformis]